MSNKPIPIDLERMSKDELILLMKQLHDQDAERLYHPDSMMAMAMASPKETRKIAWRAVHPVSKFMMFFVFGLFICIFVFILMLL